MQGKREKILRLLVDIDICNIDEDDSKEVKEFRDWWEEQYDYKISLEPFGEYLIINKKRLDKTKKVC